MGEWDEKRDCLGGVFLFRKSLDIVLADLGGGELVLWYGVLSSCCANWDLRFELILNSTTWITGNAYYES